MKKIFTLLAGVLFALGAQAQTLLDFEQSQTIGIELSGSTTITDVKLKANTLSTPGIKFDGSYQKDGAMTDKYAVLTTDGGFKAGDVVTIAGAFNNTDDNKQAAVDLFTLEGTTPTVLFNSGLFINGRTVEDMPTPVTYTLTEDVEKLYIGRNGNTATFVTTLKVVRGGTETDITEPDPVLPPTAATTWNFSVLSSTDQANLDADTENWKFDEEKSRYTYIPSFTSEQGKANNIVLKANGAELEILNGLYVGRDGSIEANKFGIDLEKGFNLPGSKYRIIIPNLAKDDEIKIRITGSADGSRGVTLTGVGTENSVASVDKAVAEGTFTVAANGNIIIETTGGLTVNALSVNAELPEEVADGISALKAETVEGNGVIYNLQGQRVDANYRGVIIKNGHKVVIK